MQDCWALVVVRLLLLPLQVQRHAAQLAQRTDAMCKTRWVKHLSPAAIANAKSSTQPKWTEEEDQAQTIAGGRRLTQGDTHASHCVSGTMPSVSPIHSAPTRSFIYTHVPGVGHRSGCQLHRARSWGSRHDLVEARAGGASSSS